MTVGGIHIPLGFYLKIEQPQSEGGTILVFIGLAAWLAAYWFVKRKQKREQLEKMEQKEKVKLYELLANIHQELQKLNQGKK